MSRFFINNSDICSNNIIITGENFKHIKSVLRHKTGEQLILCNGEGLDFKVSIVEINDNEIITHIIDSYKNETEPFVNLTLFQGIAKGDKMDFIIQKSIELGVKNIVPLKTDRTVVKFGNNKDEIKKRDRWQKIALEAAKQCNRGIIPQIGKPINFNEALDKMNKFDLSLIPYEKERSSTLRFVLSDFKKRDFQTSNVAIFIGPEGGFSEKEIETSINANIIPVTLGSRILRTETASIVTISIIMYDLGAMD